MFNTSDSLPIGPIQRIIRRRRNVARGRQILFAAGDYQEKYVPDSKFFRNPLLKKAREVALRKTKPVRKTTYSNLTADESDAIATLSKKHAGEKHDFLASAINAGTQQAEQLKAGLLHRKYNIPIASNSIKQVLEHHDAAMKSMRAKHEAELEAVAPDKVKHFWTKPKLDTKAWRDLDIRQDLFNQHEDFNKRKEEMKKLGETKPISGTITPVVGNTGGIIKGTQSKLGALTTQYGKQLGKNRSYTAENIGNLHRTRKALAEELGYKIHPGNKPGRRIEVTGRRQVIQAARKQAGTLSQPMSPEAWADLLSNRPRRKGTLSPNRPPVGLAGATPEYHEAYIGRIRKVEGRLHGMIEEEKNSKLAQADQLKTNLTARAHASILASNPQIGHVEVSSRAEESVKQILHGGGYNRGDKIGTVPRFDYHAQRIGISGTHAKKLRSQYNNLLATDTEKGIKSLRSALLNKGTPFMEPVEQAATSVTKFPLIRKTAIGVGIGAGVLGAGYLAKRFLQKKETRMSSKLSQIRFAAQQKSQRTLVTRDRYSKSIKERDLASAKSNYLRSAGVGAALGSILRKKMPLGRAAVIGAGAGLAAQAATRIDTAASKDQFGERSWQGKRVDKAPWAVGGAVGAGILASRSSTVKKLAKRVFKFSAIDDAKKKLEGQPTPAHDIAIGAVEGGLAYPVSEALVKRWAPKGSGLARKIGVGGAVGGVATGLVGLSLARLIRARKAIQENKEPLSERLSSRLALIQFEPLSPEEREARRRARRWDDSHLAARGQEIYSWAGRSKRLARDLTDTIKGRPNLDARGRPRTKEWNKPWVWKAAAIGAIGTALTYRKVLGGETAGKLIGKFNESGLGKYISGMRAEIKGATEKFKMPSVSEKLKDLKKKAQFKDAEDIANRKEAKAVQQGRFSSKLKMIRFAYNVDYWDARDLSRNQAIVTAPGGQLRSRRSKKWYEKKDVREGIAGLLVAGAGAAGYGGKVIVDRAKEKAAAENLPLAEWGKRNAQKKIGSVATAVKRIHVRL